MEEVPHFCWEPHKKTSILRPSKNPPLSSHASLAPLAPSHAGCNRRRWRRTGSRWPWRRCGCGSPRGCSWAPGSAPRRRVSVSGAYGGKVSGPPLFLFLAGAAWDRAKEKGACVFCVFALFCVDYFLSPTICLGLKLFLFGSMWVVQRESITTGHMFSFSGGDLSK